MSCSNCFNGCADIVSDQCVKYTGIPIPELGIDTGDPLLVVENQIIKKIQEIMTGAGVIPEIDPLILCPLVSSFLPCCPPLDLNAVLEALIKSLCVLDSRLTIAEGKITVIEGELAVLNADYNIGVCLTGVTASSDTHDVLQATIDSLCALTLDLHTNYVRIDAINSYIQSYLSTVPAATNINAKMVPYSIVAYRGPLTGNFDGTGAGLGAWTRIFLCNGENGTPDLRGRTIVGITDMIGTHPLDPEVNPLTVYTPPTPPNPTYTLNDRKGSNQGILTSPAQLPLHDHNPVTVVLNDPGHLHTYQSSYQDSGDSGPFITTASTDQHEERSIGTWPGPTATPTGITVTSATGTSVGAGAGHNNYQPSFALNYIIYIP